MHRPFVGFTRACLLFGAISGLAALTPMRAGAQEVVVYPDAAYVATAEPVYYNGIPHYWFRDRWYYRRAGGWAWYREGEPRWLHDYRYRAWPGGVYHPEYRYHAGYHGGWHRR